MVVSEFAKQLKKGTRKSHTMAENTSFISSFLKGVVDRNVYRQLIANFYFIYHALETEMEKNNEHNIVGLINFNGLTRHDALVEDCKYYYGSDWKMKIRPTQQAQRYVNRIHEVGKQNPELLVGHHYTRYMGDLSGGQILKRIAKNALNLKDKGLAFYDFPEISNKREFKNSYRKVLDNLPVDQSQASAIIKESNLVFRLNMHMFDEIEGDVKSPLLKIVYNFLKAFLRK
tara:strand:- start:1256 stop:1945 length:690 start_codon:yes stop_codon:yes gene_type:complete